MPTPNFFSQRLTLAFAALVLSSPCAFSADANFYTLSEKWNKSNLQPKNDPAQDLENIFSEAAANRAIASAFPGLPTPPSEHRALQEIVSSQGPVEVELNQSLFVDSIGDLVKFVATDEGIVTLTRVNSEILQITGSGLGRTFIHVWTGAGRVTFSLIVTQPKLVASRYQLQQQQAIDKNRPFVFHYDNSRAASYTGEKFRTKTRSSSDFTQNFRLTGDTPHGEFLSGMQTQNAEGKTLLTDAQVTLQNGKLGNVDNFNATLGDAPIKSDLMIFPSTRVRGGAIEHWDDAKRTEWSAFYGRENSSVIGILTPGVVAKRTRNSYLSGGILDFKLNEEAKLKTGYFTASGRSRDDDLNRRGLGVQSEIKLGDHAVIHNESDFDNEEFAHKHSVTAKLNKVQVRNEFRDINKRFVTMIGSPSRQGEIGDLIEISVNPSEHWSASGSLDIFKDRLIPNPDDTNSVNIHSDALLNVSPFEDVNMTFNFQDLDDTGRLGPSRQRTVGMQYNERFDLWGHKATIFSRYQHRTNHLLTNPLNDYRQNQITLGVYTELFWGINFSMQREWTALEEVELGRLTYPGATTYNLDYSHQVSDTPFFLETRIRIRDEENTEASNSFMSGEDSAELSGGLYYRQYDDMEIFLTGSFTQYVPESLNVLDQRIEAQFFTGMRYDLDSGIRWAARGSFEGFVFKDLNGDGVRQPEENGLSGMIVTASDGKKGVTDDSGHYQIKSVSGKTITLTLDSEKIPYGYVPSNSLAQQVDIVQNKTKQVNFSLTPRSEVAGIVFNDLNGNGKYDQTDIGVPKVKLVLENGVSVRSNNLGVYTFSGVVAGDHAVSLALSSLPAGYLPLNVPTRKFSLYEGIRFELNFPLQAKRALTGRVFYDQNRNNHLDTDEKPVPGIPVHFAGQLAVSDKDGWYLFDNIIQGSFELTLDVSRIPQGFVAPPPVKITMPAEPLTMSDIHLPVVKKSKN